MPPSDVDKDNQENFPYDAAPPSLPRVQWAARALAGGSEQAGRGRLELRAETGDN